MINTKNIWSFMKTKQEICEDPSEAKELMRKLLLARENPQSDFGVVSVYCGSGRTPESQNWPIEEFRGRKGEEIYTFRYRDTWVTYNPKYNNIEFVTTGPGTGRNAYKYAKLGSISGNHPSIEKMQEQQIELLTMLVALRQDINKELNPRPPATIIGFSRGAVAAQHSSLLIARLINNEMSLFISCDSVAGRMDPGEDHLVHPEANGVYIMSTKLQSNYSIRGFGPSYPINPGGNWEQLCIHGPHGAVIDNKSLIETLKENTDTRKPVDQRKADVSARIREVNTLLLKGSVLGLRFRIGGKEAEKLGPLLKDDRNFVDQIRNNTQYVLRQLNKKINLGEGSKAFSAVANFLRERGFGGGRHLHRKTQFIDLKEETLQLLQEENEERVKLGLPALEVLDDCKAPLRACIAELSKNWKKLSDPAGDNQLVGGILVSLRQRLIEILNTITADSSSEKIEEAIKNLNACIAFGRSNYSELLVEVLFSDKDGDRETITLSKIYTQAAEASTKMADALKTASELKFDTPGARTGSR